METIVEQWKGTPVSEQRSEVVERKGLGHPDSICDSVMEEIALAIGREYRSRFGTTLHYNLDKALLIGGAVDRRFGGGRVLQPMKLILGDRATFRADSKIIPIQEIAVETARDWFRRSFRFVNPDEHIQYQFEIRPGSAELRDIFQRGKGLLGANDTSAAVGYAPLTETESIVLETELHLNSREFKENFPETGEDVKIMAYRKDRVLGVTVAMPMLDRFIDDEAAYFRDKRRVREAIAGFVRSKSPGFDKIQVDLNTLDRRQRGAGGMYLSVLGTSAEDADSGEVGRGNRVNGLITLNRPGAGEAAAGKNHVSHVGKIYNILSHRLAHECYQNVEEIKEIYIWLGSQIGTRIDRPALVAAKILLQRGASFRSVSGKVRRRIDSNLADIGSFCEELLQGKYPVA